METESTSEIYFHSHAKGKVLLARMKYPKSGCPRHNRGGGDSK